MHIVYIVVALTMNLAEFGSRRLQQPANVNFEPIKRGLKSDFLFFEPFPCQLCCFSYQISLLEHQEISKTITKVLIDRRMVIMLINILVTIGDEDGDDGEPGAWPDLAR